MEGWVLLFIWVVCLIVNLFVGLTSVVQIATKVYKMRVYTRFLVGAEEFGPLML